MTTPSSAARLTAAASEHLVRPGWVTIGPMDHPDGAGSGLLMQCSTTKVYRINCGGTLIGVPQRAARRHHEGILEVKKMARALVETGVAFEVNEGAQIGALFGPAGKLEYGPSRKSIDEPPELEWIPSAGERAALEYCRKALLEPGPRGKFSPIADFPAELPRGRCPVSRQDELAKVSEDVGRATERLYEDPRYYMREAQIPPFTLSSEPDLRAPLSAEESRRCERILRKWKSEEGES